jgi:hypothetical protein
LPGVPVHPDGLEAAAVVSAALCVPAAVDDSDTGSGAPVVGAEPVAAPPVVVAAVVAAVPSEPFSPSPSGADDRLTAVEVTGI